MQTFSSKWVAIVVITVGSIIGLVKGTEARQKWMFRMRNRDNEKRQLVEQKKLRRSGAVALDDIEISAFHK